MTKLLLAALPLALAACNQGETAGPGAEETAPPAAVAGTPAPSPAPGPADKVGIPEFGIPVALQGNWGLVPADCTSTRGDAKGLLRVSPTTLTFYESVGRLGPIKDRSDTSIRAEYAFTGEGMEWTRDVALTASDGGETLTRLDRGGDKPGGPFTYTKCQSRSATP